MGNLPWFSKREAPKVIMLGLSQSGKTTIFRHLTKRSEFLIPVICFTIEHAECQQVKLMSWDIRSGSDGSIFKQFYRKYYGETSVIVYVVDPSATFTNFKDSIVEFEHLINEQILENVPILVLVNKITPSQMSLSEVSSLMKLTSLTRKWQIRQVNALKGEGIASAFQWVRSALPKEGIQ